MDIVAVVLGLVIGLLVGVVVTWQGMRSRTATASANAEAEQAKEVSAAESESSRLRSETADARAEAAEARAEAASARAAIESARATAEQRAAEAADARREAATLVAKVEAAVTQRDALERERDAERQRMKDILADQEAMTLRFESLSAKVLDVQSKKSEESAVQRAQATDQLLKPLTEVLASVNDQLRKAETNRQTSAAELRAQVQTMQTIGHDLRQQTSALSSALSKPQTRGQWGEMHLRRTVELAGMVDHCDFDLQFSTTTDDGTLRPDMRVQLSEGKFVYVDAKTTMAALLEARDIDSPSERERALARFGRHVKTHIDQLSNKRYWTLDTSSPEFVVMFLPSEATLQLALDQMPTLLEYAADRNVVLATPMSLIAMLRAIAFGWKQAVLAEGAAQVFAVGRELYERLGTMGGHLDKLGNQLTSAVQNYNKTVGSLETRVFVSARRLRDLQVTEAELPQPTLRTELPRAIAAPELVADAEAADQLPEIRALRRDDPTDDDLLQDLDSAVDHAHPQPTRGSA